MEGKQASVSRWRRMVFGVFVSTPFAIALYLLFEPTWEECQRQVAEYGTFSWEAQVACGDGVLVSHPLIPFLGVLLLGVWWGWNKEKKP